MGYAQFRSGLSLGCSFPFRESRAPRPSVCCASCVWVLPLDLSGSGACAARHAEAIDIVVQVREFCTQPLTSSPSSTSPRFPRCPAPHPWVVSDRDTSPSPQISPNHTSNHTRLISSPQQADLISPDLTKSRQANLALSTESPLVADSLTSSACCDLVMSLL